MFKAALSLLILFFSVYANAGPKKTFQGFDGIVPPTLTTTARNALANIIDGQTIFNSTTHHLDQYQNGSWVEFLSTSTAPTFQFLTSGTSYTTPTGATFLKVTVVGGGGAGGSCAGVTTSQASSAGGGGGGGGSIGFISSPSASYSYAVGAGGTAGSSGNNAGNAGTQSSFNSAFIGGGGPGGNGSAAAVAVEPSAAGVAGGASSGGTINVPGGQGGPGAAYLGNGNITGAGGGSLFAGQGIYSTNLQGAGPAGIGYGAGGGGCGNFTSGSAAVGGVGIQGAILVEEFY